MNPAQFSSTRDLNMMRYKHVQSDDTTLAKHCSKNSQLNKSMDYC